MTKEYFLIRFIGDGVYCIRKKSELKSLSEKPKILAKWRNSYYEAQIIFSDNNWNIIQNLYKNFATNYPVVKLERIHLANDCVTISCQNSESDFAIPMLNVSLKEEEFTCTDPNKTVSLHRKKRKVHIISDIQLNSTLEDPLSSFEQYSSDDSVKDPNYIEESDSSEQSSQHTSVKKQFVFSTAEKSLTSISDKRESLSMGNKFPFSTSPSAQNYFCDNLNIQEVLFSDSGKCKKYFCIFCQKLITKFARHIQTVHQAETEVQNIMFLPKGCKERYMKIELLRKQGCFYFNTKQAYNRGHLLVTRRPSKTQFRTASNFNVCPKCRGFYSKVSIRRHYKRCEPLAKTGDKSLSALSRLTYAQIHHKASSILKCNIFPKLKDDDISRLIQYDELAIIYGNKLCDQYRKPHLNYFIRSKLRLIGRLMLVLKKKNSIINEFASIFHPKFYNIVIEGINEVALFNENTSNFKSPATAFSYGTLLKKCGHVLINEYIKKEDRDGQTNVKNFLSILEEDFATSINRTVQENQKDNKRQKIIILPSVEDIKLLNEFLNKNRRDRYDKLKYNFSTNVWKELAEYTLTSVQVFNRWRAGEIERILIQDFLTCQSINEETDTEIYNSLSAESKHAAKQYQRFEIRGKLGRNVPVLLNREVHECITLVIKFRSYAGVSVENPFVFGMPGGNTKFLRACVLLRKYSKLCNAKKPETLRGTELRKQIATRSVLLDLEDKEVTDLANFLGHDEKIHKDHYRIPIVTRDIVRMSRLLEIAQGDKNEGLEEIMEIKNTLSLEKTSPTLVEKHNIAHYKGSMECSIIPLVDQTNTMDVVQDENNDILHDNFRYDILLEEKNNKDFSKRNVERRSWSTPEKKVVENAFNSYISNNTLPSLEYIHDVIVKNPELQNRSPLQVKSYISNRMQKMKENKAVQRTRISTQFWTKEETILMKELFKTHLLQKALPSFAECLDIISRNPIFKGRTKQTMKAWVFNEIKRHQKLQN